MRLCRMRLCRMGEYGAGAHCLGRLPLRGRPDGDRLLHRNGLLQRTRLPGGVGLVHGGRLLSQLLYGSLLYGGLLGRRVLKNAARLRGRERHLERRGAAWARKPLAGQVRPIP